MTRRPKDRSHWGDMAFKAMHDKPITREVLHKALQEPTARELIEAWNHRDVLTSPTGGFVEPDALIVSRVEKVLEFHSPEPITCGGCDSEWPCPTVRILNGESE